MALQLSVQQSGGKLLVYANNFTGDHVAIIDHIILSIETSFWSWHIAFYEDDFTFGPRVPTGWGGLMVEMIYSSGPAKAHATAAYWNVDQKVKSLYKSVS